MKKYLIIVIILFIFQGVLESEEGEPLAGEWRLLNKAGNAKDRGQRIANYRKYAEDWKRGHFPDDALLRILILSLKYDEIENAKAVLLEIEKKHPEGILRRSIYLGDPKPEVVKQCKEFIKVNPIKTVNWGKLLIAEYYYKRNEFAKAKPILEYLLKVTKKEIIPKGISTEGMSTESIRIRVLESLLKVAKQTKDITLENRLGDLIEKDYGVKPENFSLIKLCVNKYMEKLREKEEEKEKPQKADIIVRINSIKDSCKKSEKYPIIITIVNMGDAPIYIPKMHVFWFKLIDSKGKVVKGDPGDEPEDGLSDWYIKRGKEWVLAQPIWKLEGMSGIAVVWPDAFKRYSNHLKNETYSLSLSLRSIMVFDKDLIIIREDMSHRFRVNPDKKYTYKRVRTFPNSLKVKIEE
jgi:hypothetical protein